MGYLQLIGSVALFVYLIRERPPQLETRHEKILYFSAILLIVFLGLALSFYSDYIYRNMQGLMTGPHNVR